MGLAAGTRLPLRAPLVLGAPRAGGPWGRRWPCRVGVPWPGFAFRGWRAFMGPRAWCRPGLGSRYMGVILGKDPQWAGLIYITKPKIATSGPIIGKKALKWPNSARSPALARPGRAGLASGPQKSRYPLYEKIVHLERAKGFRKAPPSVGVFGLAGPLGQVPLRGAVLGAHQDPQLYAPLVRVLLVLAGLRAAGP